jgi:hypothetical protein
MLQDRLAALEGAERCIATASGMAAILCSIMALLKSGDHIVASQSIFGATQQMLGNILPRFGIETTFVTGSATEDFQAALKPNTRMVFIETPSNPLTTVFDIAALAQMAHAAGTLLAVDNCFCTPALQRPLDLGADLVIHSATKYLDGQGRVLGGAICSNAALGEEIFKFLRTAGASLSPFNAWVILKGLETLGIRMQANRPAPSNWPAGWKPNPRSPAYTTPAWPHTRSTPWPPASSAAPEPSCHSKSKAAGPLPGASSTTVNCCRSPPTWATPKPPSPTRPAPPTAASAPKHALRQVSAKACCASPSAWKPSKTSRPTWHAAWGRTD